MSENSLRRRNAFDGGIFSSSNSVVSLNDSIVSGNESGVNNGGNGGGIHASGVVSLTNSTVSGNSSGNGSGGIGIFGQLFGPYGSLTLINSSVSDNRVTDDGGIGGGIVSSNSDVSLTNSTVSGNSVIGISSQGGGIFTSNGYLSLTNSTVSGNSSGGLGGGIRVISNFSPVQFVNSTVTDNLAAGAGGGISFERSQGLILQNSIVAGNTDEGAAPDLFATFSGDSELIVEHSLIGDTTGSGVDATTGTGNILNQSALLGPLADNGGPTLTHALLVGSPAIDSGSNLLAVDENGNALTTDQRGEDRIQFGTVDIGAVELEAADPFLLGDANLDGEVNFLDISPFISLLSGNVFLNEADINRDGTVNFLDISPFITLLANGSSTAPVVLGDASQDGEVNFLDISPFISLLSGDTFLDEANINRDGSVNFLDISPFISILSTGGAAQSNLVAVDSDKASVSQDFGATTESTVVAPVSTAVSEVSEPASIVSVASTVDVTITETLLVKISANTPATVSPTIALRTSQSPLVLVSESLASPAFEAKQLPVLDAEVVGATPVDTYTGPVALVTAGNSIFGERDSGFRAFESDGPVVTRRSLKGSAESLDFSYESRDQHPSTRVSTADSYSSAAELFDAHPESLDDVFDFEIEETLVGLI